MKYITIEKNQDKKGFITVDSSSSVYVIPSDVFAEFMKSEIKKFDIDNKKARKNQLKTDLKSIKQLVKDGYCIHAEAGDYKYSISLRYFDEDKKRPYAFFTTLKKDGMATLFDKAEEWAQACIDDYGVQI